MGDGRQGSRDQAGVIARPAGKRYLRKGKGSKKRPFKAEDCSKDVKPIKLKNQLASFTFKKLTALSQTI
jgi:hypothetical protein